MYAPPGGGHPLARRRAPLSVFSAVAAVVMMTTACGDGSGGSEEVNLRFSWWGADDRHATIQQVIENFEAENRSEERRVGKEAGTRGSRPQKGTSRTERQSIDGDGLV